MSPCLLIQLYSLLDIRLLHFWSLNFSQPPISHLSAVSHWNDEAFYVYSNKFSKQRESSWKSAWDPWREIWWWSNVKILYNHKLPLSPQVSYLSLTDTLSQSAFFCLGRSPPRPSPGSLHYSDEDVSTKYNDLIPAESSSLTEKPSEISDSQVSSNLSFRFFLHILRGNELELKSSSV